MFDEEVDELWAYGEYEDPWWQEAVFLEWASREPWLDYVLNSIEDWALEILQDNPTSACEAELALLATALGVDVDSARMPEAVRVVKSDSGFTVVISMSMGLLSDRPADLLSAQTYASAIERAWSGQFQSGDASFSILTNIIVTTTDPSPDFYFVVQPNPEFWAGIGNPSGTTLLDQNTIYYNTVFEAGNELIAGHEFGHVLGFEHEPADASSIMAPDGGEGRLTVAEVAALAAAYAQDCAEGM